MDNMPINFEVATATAFLVMVHFAHVLERPAWPWSLAFWPTIGVPNTCDIRHTSSHFQLSTVRYAQWTLQPLQHGLQGWTQEQNTNATVLSWSLCQSATTYTLPADSPPSTACPSDCCRRELRFLEFVWTRPDQYTPLEKTMLSSVPRCSLVWTNFSLPLFRRRKPTRPVKLTKNGASPGSTGLRCEIASIFGSLAESQICRCNAAFC